MTRCVLYGRISLEEGSQYGMPSQLRAMREYAKSRGYEVLEEVEEEYTGKTLDRPKLGRLREMAREQKFEVLIAHSLDRITRRMGQLVALRDGLKSNGVRIEYVVLPTDESIESRVMQTMIEAFADYEREKIHERTLRGRREKARRGLVVAGKVPYGYRYDAGHLVVIEGQAQVVRRIFAWADAGLSQREITRRLNGEGIASHSGKRWGRSSVNRLLHQEGYCGQYWYNRRQRHGTVLRPRGEAEWISIIVPAIIDRDLYERVRGKLKQNAESWTGRPTRRYLLRGLLWCRCGRRMGGDPGKGTPCYRCAGRDGLRNTGQPCLMMVNGTRIEAAVWSAATSPFQNPTNLKNLVEQHWEALRSPTGKDRIDQLKKCLETCQFRERRAYEELIKVDPDLARFAREALNRATQVRREAERNVTAVQEIPTEADVDIEGYASEVRAGMRAVADSSSGRQEFLRKVVSRVVYGNGEVEVEVFIMPKEAQSSARYQRFSITVKAKVA